MAHGSIGNVYFPTADDALNKMLHPMMELGGQNPRSKTVNNAPGSMRNSIGLFPPF